MGRRTLRGPRFGYAQFIADKFVEANIPGDFTINLGGLNKGRSRTKGKVCFTSKIERTLIGYAHPYDKDNGGCRRIQLIIPTSFNADLFYEEVVRKLAETNVQRGRNVDNTENPKVATHEPTDAPPVEEASDTTLTTENVSDQSAVKTELAILRRAIKDEEYKALISLEMKRKMEELGTDELKSDLTIEIMLRHLQVPHLGRKQVSQALLRPLSESDSDSSILEKKLHPSGGTRGYALTSYAQELITQRGGSLGSDPEAITERGVTTEVTARGLTHLVTQLEREVAHLTSERDRMFSEYSAQLERRLGDIAILISGLQVIEQRSKPQT